MPLPFPEISVWAWARKKRAPPPPFPPDCLSGCTHMVGLGEPGRAAAFMPCVHGFPGVSGLPRYGTRCWTGWILSQHTAVPTECQAPFHQHTYPKAAPARLLYLGPSDHVLPSYLVTEGSSRCWVQECQHNLY